MDNLIRRLEVGVGYRECASDVKNEYFDLCQEAVIKIKQLQETNRHCEMYTQELKEKKLAYIEALIANARKCSIEAVEKDNIDQADYNTQMMCDFVVRFGEQFIDTVIKGER